MSHPFCSTIFLSSFLVKLPSGANDNDDVAVDDAVSDGGECNSCGKGFGSLSCSICLDLITDNGDRSWAKLQCGHQFHFEDFVVMLNMDYGATTILTSVVTSNKWSNLFSMDGDFASMVELVKLRKNSSCLRKPWPKWKGYYVLAAC
ncbi:hypothetical protein Patl1_11987 [Pistacia atlantica]|uniref:Uncharacterized protein n=1 Tax=Pistacia atlantica TaxID=434234 RepID=A0ACC1A0G0_9ROSI|nr:hypothetical protein Patl1_11987 [Pistacia atlantica]